MSWIREPGPELFFRRGETNNAAIPLFIFFLAYSPVFQQTIYLKQAV